MTPYFKDFQRLMSSFLGSPKNDITDSGQLQFPCPRCVSDKGDSEASKFNLEVNLFKGFQCWSCCSMDDEMRGSISKLIKLYGNEHILRKYRDLIRAMRSESLYEIHFKDTHEPILREDIKLPVNFRPLVYDKYAPKKVMDYLSSRGIGWDIIEEFGIGYTAYDESNLQVSSRIILPSYNEYGELNYWTGRDYTGKPKRQKYFNPKAERKDLIFNEDKVLWDADITLVEGPFDHIVVPNSIPLLGKSLTPEYKIYKEILKKANANINIFLDADAYTSVIKIYKLLDQGRLKDKIRYIPVNENLDPSEIYKISGNRGILEYLSHSKKISEFDLHVSLL